MAKSNPIEETYLFCCEFAQFIKVYVKKHDKMIFLQK